MGHGYALSPPKSIDPRANLLHNPHDFMAYLDRLGIVSIIHLHQVGPTDAAGRQANQ
jgi:hypothetical protein